MTTTIRVVRLIATVCGQYGPTDECREVLRVAIVDGGGNVYGHATTPRGALRIQNRLRLRTLLRAEKLGKIVPPEAFHLGYTLDCGLCD